MFRPTPFSVMNRAKLILGLFTAGITLCSLVAWVGLGVWITYGSKNLIIKELKARLNWDVAIEKVYTDFLNGVYLKGVTVRQPFEAHADQIKLTFQPWQVLWPCVVSFTNVDSTVLLKKKPFVLQSFNGQMKVRPTKIHSELKGTVENMGPLTAAFSADLEVDPSWAASFNFDAIPLESIQEHLRSRASKAWGTFKGKASGQLTIKGDGLFWRPSKADWVLEAQGSKIHWTSFDESLRFPFSAHIRLDSRALLIEKMEVARGIFAKGKINSVLKNPDLDLEIRGDQVQVNQLLRLFPRLSEKGNLWSGQTSFSLGIQGHPKTPDIKGDLTIEPRYSGVKLPAISGFCSMGAERAFFEGSFANGQIRLEGPGFSAHGDYHVNLDDVSLFSIAQIHGWKNVSGSLRSDFLFNTLKEPSRVRGTFLMQDLQWARHKADRNLKGSFEFSKNGFSIDSEDGSVQTKGRLLDSTVRIHQSQFVFGESRVFGSGDWDVKKGTFSFSVRGDNVLPDVWPPMVDRYPDITGLLNFEGWISNAAQESNQANLDLSFRQLRFRKDGKDWSGRTRFSLRDKGFALSDIHLEGGYQGDARWENASWYLNVDMKRADPQLLADLSGSTVPWTGELNGKAEGHYSDGNVSGEAAFTWNKGKIGPVRFEKGNGRLHVDQNKIFVTELGIEQSGRAIRAEGEIGIAAPGWAYRFDVKFQRWPISTLFVDGEIMAAGTFGLREKSIAGKISTPILWINDFPIEQVEGVINKTNEKWNVSVKSDSDLTLAGEFDTASRSLQGHFAARNVKAQMVLGCFLSPHSPDALPEGPASITASLGGTFDSPVVAAKIASSSLKWRNEKMKVQAQVDLNGSTVSIRAARIELMNGGAVELTGSFGQNARIKGEAWGMDLQSVLHLLRWPVKWQGKVDGDLLITREQGRRQATVQFKGNHSGFGPFEHGGVFSGKASWSEGTWSLSGIRVKSGSGHVQLLDGSEIFMDGKDAGRLRLVADVRNLQARVLNFFGRAELLGKWKALNDSSQEWPVELDIFARSLWINQFVLDGNVTHLTLKKGEIEFSPIFGSGQQLSGTLETKDWPSVRINDFRFLDKGQERVYADGVVGPDKWDFKLNLKEVDAGILRGLFDTTLPMAGPMDVHLVGRGSSEDPHLFAEVDWKNGSLALVPLGNAVCKIEYKKDRIQVTDLNAFKKKGYQLSGQIDFTRGSQESTAWQVSTAELALSKGDLTVLQEMWPECKDAEGSFEARLSVAKKNEKITISGFLNAQNVEFRSSSYIPQMKDGEFRIRFTHDRLFIEQAKARLGKGEAYLTGHIDFEDGRPKRYDLRLNTAGDQGILLRVPDLTIPPGPLLGRFGIFKRKLAGVSRGEPKILLVLKGPATAPLLSGKIVLDNTIFTYPPKKRTGRGRSFSSFRWLATTFERLHWNLVLEAGSRTWYENEIEDKLGLFVNSRISGLLSMKGSTSDLSLNGRISSTQGSVLILGSEFKLNDALLEVQTSSSAVGAVEKPEVLVYLRATAERDVYYTDALGNGNQDTIMVQVDRAQLADIKPRFYSKGNPSMSPEKASELALGIVTSDDAPSNSLLASSVDPQTEEENDRLVRTTIIKLIDSSLASPLARAIARQTGLIDFIRVTYQEKDIKSEDRADSTPKSVSATAQITENPWLRYAKGTKVKLGRELSSRLFADYSFRVDEFENQVDLRHELELAYRLHRNFFIRAVSELDTERTLGRPPDRRAILENQWRFGLPKKKTVNPPQQSRAVDKASKSAAKNF